MSEAGEFEKTNLYFKRIEDEVRKSYAIAEEAKKTGLDPVDKVEIPLAMSMAEKVVGLISTIYPQMEGSGIAERILDLEKDYGKLDSTVVFKIAEEVAKQKFCKFSSLLEAIDAGIRIGFAYTTLGVVSSPIEGFTQLKLGKTRDGKEYFIVYFSGPIRSAGTTASCVVLMLIDYLRELFGFAKYDPTEEEVKRYVTENYDYHDRVTNLQYCPTEEEITFLAKNLPIQIAGEPTEKLEVSNYKNLERVETNYIRGGMCLIFSEGLAQKAAKGFRLLNKAKDNGIVSTGFDFISEYIELHEKRNKGKLGGGKPTYIKDLVAGRPVFGHPSESGGFRFRYGRSRVSGFSAVSFHPATMAITDDFIATGTQLKIEKPTKGCVGTACDTIDGPIVKLFNGSVKKLNSKDEAKKLYKDVEEIIYLGDILFPFSDVLNRNAEMIKPGYVEEWWNLELKEKGGEVKDYLKVDFETALELSKKYEIPLHPSYIFYWTQIKNEQFSSLIKWLSNSVVRGGKIVLPYTKKDQEEFLLGKRALELLGVEHEVTIENVVLSNNVSKSFLFNLGIDFSLLDKEILVGDYFDEEKFVFSKDEGVLEIVSKNCDFEIKDKAGEFIGTRMGRPEKAKLRKLVGSPNVLFPIGSEGGRLRSLQAACEVGSVKSLFPIYFCEKCNKETIYRVCEDCHEKTKKMFYCRDCDKKSLEPCEEHNSVPYSSTNLDINHYYKKAMERLGLTKDQIPTLIKGIRGTSSGEHVMENLAKGILRSKFELQVNKDGTIRFDATELPLSHFKPKEISVSVEKLIELGYTEDIYGKKLENEEQMLEIMPHDILLPSSPESPDERADNVFMKISNFIDEELERFYKMKRFYNLKTKDDLVGQLGVFMAPHNCAGVICRFIGFSNTQGLLASPYMHAAVRRDCFDYNTYIPIMQNGSWRNVKIGELVNDLNPSKIVDSFGTVEKKVKDFKTIGFDKELKEVKINNFTKHPENLMFEIKTSLGKKIRVTENHKFLVDGKIKRASSLEMGDKLPLSKKITIKTNNLNEINLLDFLNDENLMIRGIGEILSELDDNEKGKILDELNISKKQFMNYKLRDSYPISFIYMLNENIKKRICLEGKIFAKGDTVGVPIVIKLDKELLEIIGLYIAEGYSRSIVGEKGLNQVYISSDDRVIRDFVKKTIFNHFGLKPSERKEDRVTFSSKVLYLFFIKILECGCKARDKRIPYLFLDFPLEKLACVLRGYFEGDGSVSLKDRRVTCDSVSEGLLSDLEFCLSRFEIFTKRYDYEKEPGPKVREFYISKKRKIPKFKITKIIICSDFVNNFNEIGFLSDRKTKILQSHNKGKFLGMRIHQDENFVYDPIVSIEEIGKKESYCLNVETKNHLVVGNSIVSFQCDGDEAAIMLLLDVLLNFSRKFLPGHRGGTQDAPLVLNAKIDAGEVDDQILDLEFVSEEHYPLELYQKAEKKVHSSNIELETCKSILKKGKNPFIGIGFTHNTSNFNNGVVCSSYKLLATMQEKVQHQMELVDRIRAADTSDTARLIIERHFIRDMRGNLRKFSMQQFRCVACNTILRRPPLTGICPSCGGKIIFTIHEGGIKKYLEPAIDLAKKYHLSKYIEQSLELTKRYIDSVFGKELEKQEALERWF